MNRIWTIGALALMAVLAACGKPETKSAGAAATGHADWRAQVKEVRIGISGSERDTQRMSRLNAYSDHISKRIGVPVSFVQASDYSGVVQAIAAKQIEMAITGADAYVAMYEASNGNVEPLVTNLESDGSTGYFSVLFVRSDSPYQTLEDLKGKTIAYADANSTSGYLFPRFAMRRQGLDPDTFFSNSTFAGGHPQTVISVVNRQFDAGVTWASGQGDVNQGYTRGNLHTMVENKQLDMKDLRVIRLLGPIPNGPTVIRKDMPQELKDLLRGVLTAMSYEVPDIYNSVTEGDGGGYMAVPPDFYKDIFAMRDEERAARRN